MSLTGYDYRQFHAALLDAFPSLPALQQMVAQGLNENLANITSSESLSDTAIALIRWAESQGRLGALLEAAQRAAPDSTPLRALAVAVGVSSLSLTREQRNRLLRALNALPNIGDPAVRRALLDRLPPDLTATLGYSDSRAVDLANIARVVETWGPVDGTAAILTLIENAIRYVKGSRLAQDLTALRQELVVPSRAAPALAPEQRQRLLDLLLSMPVFTRIDGRNLLLNDLPPSLVSQIARSSIEAIDLANIVRAVEAWGILPDGVPALHLLIQNALVFTHGLKSRTADFQDELEAIDQWLVTGSRSVEASLDMPPNEPIGSSKSLPPSSESSYESSFVAKSALRLTPILRRQLQGALLSAFPRQADLEQMVFFSLGLNLYQIATGSSLSEIVLNLLIWAESSGRVEELVAAGLSRNSGNRHLQEVAAELGLIPR